MTDKRKHRRPGPRSKQQGRPQEHRGESAVEPGGIRLNKYVARAGICSRRKADTLIDEGRVKVNGVPVREYWHKVEAGDQVEVNGHLISPRRFTYVLLNKPRNTITTTSDERGRATVMDLLTLPAGEGQGLYPVGRLDRDTTGILLLTNDGELAHRLMHPRYEITKRYVVRTEAAVKPHQIDQLKRGIELEDGPARADQAVYLEAQNHREIGLEIHEGRNRQIRRMFDALGHRILALERVAYADLDTTGVRRGKWRRLHAHEVKRLRNLVHLK